MDVPTTSGAKTNRAVESLARSFLEFADAECGSEPVYDAICRIAASSEAMLTMLWEAPVVQQKPNLFLAAIHDVILEGADHPLASYFPSVGGDRGVDAAFVACAADFVRAHDGPLRSRIATRSTQTNEIGRCAVLAPCLALIASERGGAELALLDVGCSAGLNLGVDAYRYDYGAFSRGADEGALVIPCELRSGDGFASLPAPSIVDRLGVDPAPARVDDDVAMRWLRACLWPNDRERAARFDRAVAIARRRRDRIVRESDTLDAIERFLRAVPRGVVPVVFHSWVLFYFEPHERERFGVEMERLVARHDAVWLSAEAESLRIGTREPPPRGPAPGSTAWIACSKGGGMVRDRLLARSHPHGRWLEWLG